LARGGDDTSGTNCAPGAPYSMKMLTSVGLPSGETWSMPIYDTTGSATGHLRRMVLPTGGALGWDYTIFNFPNSSAPKPMRTHSVGVMTRRVIDPVGNITGTWSYKHLLSAFNRCTETGAPPPSPPSPGDKLLGDARELVALVTTPDGVTTANYFSVF